MIEPVDMIFRWIYGASRRIHGVGNVEYNHQIDVPARFPRRVRSGFRRACRSRFRSHLPRIHSVPKNPRTCFEGPFGEVIRATGPMAKANPFRFSTKFDDDETDFLYFGYRYYIPSTGRWLSRDPLGEAAFFSFYSQSKPLSESKTLARAALGPTYTFVFNQPTITSDSLGLDRWGYFVPIHAYVIIDRWDERCCWMGTQRIELLPRYPWLEFVALTGVAVPSTVQFGPIVPSPSRPGQFWYKETKCKQDKAAYAVAVALASNPPMYQILGDPPYWNCLGFAYVIYNIQ